MSDKFLLWEVNCIITILLSIILLALVVFVVLGRWIHRCILTMREERIRINSS